MHLKRLRGKIFENKPLVATAQRDAAALRAGPVACETQHKRLPGSRGSHRARLSSFYSSPATARLPLTPQLGGGDLFRPSRLEAPA
jgi:hypothetical protein